MAAQGEQGEEGEQQNAAQGEQTEQQPWAGLERLLERQLQAQLQQNASIAHLTRRVNMLGEIAVERLNWLEWRDSLRFESEWQPQSLQASLWSWKAGVSCQPSRSGDDRDGARGSPMSESDKAKAESELSESELLRRHTDFPRRLWRELGIDPEEFQRQRATYNLGRQRADLDHELATKGGGKGKGKGKLGYKGRQAEQQAELAAIEEGVQGELAAIEEGEQAEQQGEQQGQLQGEQQLGLEGEQQPAGQDPDD